MKSILNQCSKRWGYDGWAIRMPDGHVLDWTTSTTRAECRALRKERADLFLEKAEIVKVRINVEVVK